MIKRGVLTVLALVAMLALALGVNTLRKGSQQLAVQPLPPLKLDVDAAAASLATAVRARTQSGLLMSAEQKGAAFEQLHAHLRQRYPLVHSQLEREVVGAGTLVFTWKGSEPKLAPMAMLAHQDVVPISPGTEGLWKQPPWGGVIADGFVWGRGAWDNKGNLISQLEAVEMLLASGFAPKRTVILIFGHDEELGGAEGIQVVAARFKQQGLRLYSVLDEGLLVTEGILPGIDVPIALIGVAEKGGLSLRLSADGKPGHSSMPPSTGQGPLGMVAAAVARVDAAPLPGGIKGVARTMFETLAPEFGLAQRVALSNLWLTRGMLEQQLAKGPSTNALMRTTTALTIFKSGDTHNVLPGRAEAVVNFRLLPGDDEASVTEHVKRAVADERIKIERVADYRAPSRVSSSTAPAFRHVEQAVREVFTPAVVTPGLMLGGTDAVHLEGVADNVYRFSPVRARAEDLNRFHGTDERVSLANFGEMIRFYHRYLTLAASSTVEGSAP
jgi:carboxypeptidase PM20D1